MKMEKFSFLNWFFKIALKISGKVFTRYRIDKRSDKKYILIILYLIYNNNNKL